MSSSRTTGATFSSLRLAETTEPRDLRNPNSDPLRDSLIEIPSEYAEGQLIADKYRLIRKLGEGGMGTVWVADNVALGVKVAIKLIAAGQVDPLFVARLSQEAQAAAQLGHPAIIRVFDFGRTEHDAPFIAMELLHGEDLATALQRRGSLSEKRAVQTILPVIHAMAAAHEKGIVHRDLKPANIFLSRTDGGGLQPKLLDFGVAKLDRDDFKRLTRDGALLGSPAYMSPEQAQGEDVDRSADLWAICVVLYEMITGNLPFNGDNYNRLLWSIAQDNPAPTSTQFGGDPRLWAILERGFQKRRAMRWESMQDLGAELARWLHSTGCREDIAGVSLQTTWLDRKMSDTDLLASDSELPGPPQRVLARQRRADLIETLPNSESRSDTREPEPNWRTSRMWLLVVAVVVLLSVPLGAFLLLRGSDDEELAPEAVTPESAEIPALTTAVAPVEEPVAAKAPPEEPEPEASAPMASASAAPEESAAQPAPPRRPRPAPRRPAPRGRLKNPFD